MHFTHDDYREKLNGVPFHPFRLVTTPGRTFDIRDPNLVFVGINYLMIAQPATVNPSLPGPITRVAFSHVTEIEDL